MGKAVRFLARNFPFGPYARLQRANRNPARAQERVLRDLLTTAAETEFGKQHDFAGALRERDLVRAYQQRVPLAADADLRPQLDRTLHGEADVLWPGTCSLGSISGGTTTAGKVYPVNQEYIRNKQQFGMCLPLAFVAESGDASMFRGKALALSGSMQQHSEYPGLMIGEGSGVSVNQVQNRKRVANRMITMPPSDQGLTWSDRVLAAVERAVDEDVRMIFTVAGWGSFILETAMRLAEQRRGKPVKSVMEVWPNLRLITGGGTPLRPYRSIMEQHIGSSRVAIREAYGTTQALMAFQTVEADDSMQLWISGRQFYEFVPWEEYGKPNPRRFAVGEIEPGALYVPYVSTCAGLWSLSVDDIVRFSSVRPPKLHVVGRTSECLDSTGEYVLREDAQLSLEAACRATDCVATDYHLAPAKVRADCFLGHQLLVEFERTPASLERFVEAFDKAMQDINPKYRLWRTERGLRLTEIVALPRGVFQEWLYTSRPEVRLQSKIPRVRERRDIADALLELASSRSQHAQTP